MNPSSTQISPSGSTSSCWPADGHAEAAKLFWQRVADAPVLRLPLAKALQTTPAFDELALPIDADTNAAIADLAARYGSTPAVVVQAAWHAFLSRFTEQDDLVVSDPQCIAAPSGSGGRGGPDRAPAARQNAGAGRPHVRRARRSTRSRTGPGGDLSGQSAVRRDPRRPRIPRPAQLRGRRERRSLLADPDRRPRSNDAVGARVRAVAEARPSAGADLRPDDDRAASTRTCLPISSCGCSAALSRIREPVGDLDLLGDDDRRLLLAELNDTAAELPDIPRSRALRPARRRDGPRRSPSPTAASSLSYAALDARANQVAHALRRGRDRRRRRGRALHGSLGRHGRRRARDSEGGRCLFAAQPGASRRTATASAGGVGRPRTRVAGGPARPAARVRPRDRVPRPRPGQARSSGDRGARSRRRPRRPRLRHLHVRVDRDAEGCLGHARATSPTTPRT